MTKTIFWIFVMRKLNLLFDYIFNQCHKYWVQKYNSIKDLFLRFTSRNTDLFYVMFYEVVSV